jgi:hypothetical protein
MYNEDMKQLASFSLGDLAMNSFNTQLHSDENFEPTQDQILELLQEAAEIEDAQRQEEVRQTFFGDLFPEGHTDEAYDAWRESQIHGGIWG